MSYEVVLTHSKAKGDRAMRQGAVAEESGRYLHATLSLSDVLGFTIGLTMSQWDRPKDYDSLAPR